MIKWKRENKNLKPDAIFEHIKETRKHPNSGFNQFEYSVILSTMLDFGREVSDQQKEFLIRTGIQACWGKECNAKIFLDTVNGRYKSTLAKEPEVYQLITTISATSLPRLRKIKIDECEIEICDLNSYPEHWKQRSKLLKSTRKEDPDWTGVTRVIVKTSARNPELAAERCLNSLNLLRAIICFALNPRLQITFGNDTDPKPINTVRLGKFHTLHYPSGKTATETYWFEPHYSGKHRISLNSEQQERIPNWIKWHLKRMEKLKFKDLLKKAILRYVAAFDHTDLQSTIIMGWSALEMLAANEKEQNNDKISRRCSFLWAESPYHRQIIEHVREYRNRNVHYGEERGDVRTICYQLHRYFVSIVNFYLRSATQLKDLDEANSFLDSPPDEANIKRKIKVMKLAYKFRKPPSSPPTQSASSSNYTPPVPKIGTDTENEIESGTSNPSKIDESN